MAEPPPVDPWCAVCVGTFASASLATWFVLVRRRPILESSPRDLVPWNFVASAIIALLVVARLVTVVLGDEPQAGQWSNPQEMAKDIALSVANQLVLFGALFFVVAVMSGATRRDVGLPDNAGELRRDLKIGAIGWLAALLPVYGLQGFLVSLAGEPSNHPLIVMIQKDANSLVMFAAFAAAVVVAPICEEIAFRLLMQGWLEKWEDGQLGWRAPLTPPEGSVETVESQPPRIGVGGFPYGWLPILASSFMFAAGHAGHGPDPIPLFVLAILLGYMYQRTHHIIPCIVTHMLFNLTTLVAMYWAWMYRE
jgi:membrane protease YdiL (CAAX protease family)